jgi:UDP-glucose 4-epimerase
VSTVLVTGGAGFVGIPTVRRLLDAGHEVVVFDNFTVGTPERLAALDPSRLRIVQGDLRDAREVHEAVVSSAPQALIHLAAVHFIPYCDAHPAETLSVNVEGLQHVLDAASAAGVGRLVFVSTADVYSPSETPHTEDDETVPGGVYGASKLMGEWLIRFWRQRGAATRPIVTRLFNVAGPGETNPHVLSDIIEHLQRGDEVALGNRTPRRDYVFVEDVAQVLVGLLDVDASDVAVNLGSGRSWSVEDLVTRIAALTGRDLVIKTDPSKVRATDRPNLQADLTRLQQLLPGFVPTPLDRTLAETLAAAEL